MASIREQNVAGSITLEELVALNDEIAGLVRSGVPLELGLAGWGRSVPGRLGRIVRQLADSVAQGKTLPQSLAEQGPRFPQVYQAMVTAGIRGGRLPAALESLAASARNLQEVRRSINLAILYPLVLLVLGYIALLLLFSQILPVLMSMYEGQPPQHWMVLIRIGELAATPLRIPFTDYEIAAAWIPPLVGMLVVFTWWLSTRRAAVLGPRGGGRFLQFVPVARSAVHDARLASVAEIMGMLVEQGVPLSEAAVLAANCAADRRMISAAGELARAVDRGGAPPAADQLDGFPPLLAWMISAGSREEVFVSVARHVADTHRRRVVRQARWLRDYLPMWLVLAVGGGIVTLLGLMTFLPFSELMVHFGETLNNSLRIKP
jgi:general secretion pathway protein F